MDDDLRSVLPKRTGYDLEAFATCWQSGHPLWLCLDISRRAFLLARNHYKGDPIEPTDYEYFHDYQLYDQPF